MKITLEPTEKTDKKPYHSTVSISVADDDLNLEEVIEMVKGALIAFGYSADSVKEYFSE